MTDRIQSKKLTDEERAIYEWQMWVPGYGEAGQEKLKGATALISRCGGLGSPVAQELAAAGIGKLVIAHGGNVKHSDLNRQILMTYDWLGKPRVESAMRRLSMVPACMMLCLLGCHAESASSRRPPRRASWA